MKKGDKVKIYNHTPQGKKILEGTAKLIKKLKQAGEPNPESWLVEFGDGDRVIRWIET